MQRTIESHLPQLAAVVADLVELSVQKAAAGGDPWQAVDDLVAAARWNPALLMAAAQKAAEADDAFADDRFEAALDYLRAAEVRVRKRVY